MFTIKIRTGITEFSVHSADSFRMGKASEVVPGSDIPEGAISSSIAILAHSASGERAFILRKGQEAFVLNESGRTIERLIG